MTCMSASRNKACPLVASITVFPTNPFFHLVILDVKKYVCIDTSQHVNACKYNWQFDLYLKGMRKLNQKKVFPYFGGSTFYYFQTTTLFQGMILKRVIMFRFNHVGAIVPAHTKRHILFLKCFILSLIQHKHIIPEEQHHGNVYVLSLRLPIPLKSI